MSSVTFVTCFLSIYNREKKDDYWDIHWNDHWDNQWRYQQFEKLAQSGIQLCLCACSTSYDVLNTLIEEKKYSNVKLIKKVDLEDTLFYHSCKDIDFTLPNNRSQDKDTEKYMYVINSKIEFMKYAIDRNPWNSTHFAWIDFSIAYVFKHPEATFEKLALLSTYQYPSKILLFPGCWNKLNPGDIEYMLNKICWRFCGGFFLGDADSMREFYESYKIHFPSFVNHYKKLVWEVNFWAGLEATLDWKPEWYLADHNDSIIDIPTRYYALLLDAKLQKVSYEYPVIENFFPSNTAYVFHAGKHILNTRFINYSYNEYGCYDIRDPDRTIYTKNLVSELDGDLLPLNYVEMDESTVGLVSHNMYSMGLEDIRLYSYQNKVRFIATNVNYVGSRSNRMIVGDYDPEIGQYSDCRIIQPPTDTSCEKNWIPIVRGEEEFFVYTWSPYRLGKINYDTNQLEIVESYEIKSPDFHRIRGSSIFVKNARNGKNGRNGKDGKDALVGVVHYCEETNPRQYYHMLVSLDQHTLLPIAYSDPFCFQHYGVEFCIGFTIKEGKYVFWVSKKDNETIMVTIEKEDILLRHVVVY
jgi:hypothetical protein